MELHSGIDDIMDQRMINRATHLFFVTFLRCMLFSLDLRYNSQGIETIPHTVQKINSLPHWQTIQMQKKPFWRTWLVWKVHNTLGSKQLSLQGGWGASSGFISCF